MPASLDSAVAAIKTELRASYGVMLNSSSSLRDHIDTQVVNWRALTHSALRSDFPFGAHEQALRKWQPRLQASPTQDIDGLRAVEDFLEFCRAAKQTVEETFWKKQFIEVNTGNASGRNLADTSVSARLLLQQWQKRMDQVRAKWELCEIAARRAQLLKHLDELLKILQQLHDRLHDMGLDPGLLIDLSTGELREQDLRQFERWASYLAQDDGIKRLCDLLGRMRQIELSERIERVKSLASVVTPVPDINSREEIVGIRLGRDIEHALPSELALLADPDTALLFDLKYVESALMCFDMQGMDRPCLPVEQEQDMSVSQSGKHGPMVICIDTSGSMQGMPETVAKAVALFLAAKARESQRPCYLINFSTTIATLDLSGGAGFKALMRFLQMSFHGGTDVAPALEHALNKMEEESYRRADLLVISDFIVSDLPQAFLERVERRRQDGNRFHSLVIGEAYLNHRLRTHFDNEWVYHPDAGLIHELLGFERKMFHSGAHGASPVEATRETAAAALGPGRA